ITWWRNDGGNPIQWTEFNIDTYFNGAHRVQAVDIDQDQDLDILAVAYFNNEVAWYSNNGGNPLTWTKQTIGIGLFAACIAQAADLDGDGDLDVAATGQTSNEVCWWRNDGGSPIVWTKLYIDEDFSRVWPLYVCDIDDDGDQDAVAASGWAGISEVRWYENTGTGIAGHLMTPEIPQNSGPTIMSSSAIFHLGHGERLLDIAGRAVKSTSIHPGIYFTEVDGRIVSKIVVVK
ncbi:MAG: VCBS repeat-containing protein, partial [candidate division WOR-3 bacterium]